MKSASFLITLLVSLSFFPGIMPGQTESGGLFTPLRTAYGEENWKLEFEDICGNTDDSMKLSLDELKNLITRCDRVKTAIESLEETPRKVYLKKLQMCRNLLVFVLETKKKK